MHIVVEVAPEGFDSLLWFLVLNAEYATVYSGYVRLRSLTYYPDITSMVPYIHKRMFFTYTCRSTCTYSYTCTYTYTYSCTDGYITLTLTLTLIPVLTVHGLLTVQGLAGNLLAGNLRACASPF